MIVAASFDVNNPEQWVNRGLSYGDGLFETMHLSNHRIPLLDFHQQRLTQDLKRLQLKPFDWGIIDDLLVHQKLVNGSAVLKLMVFRASQARTYTPLTTDIEWVLTTDDLSQGTGEQSLRLALSEQFISQQSMLAGIKHLSRLEQVMLCAEKNQYHGVDDVLLMDDSQHIIETGYQNIVMLKAGRLITPKLDQSGVKGVALRWLAANHELMTANVGLEMLRACDVVMVCNSIRGFRLVESIQLAKNQCISFGTSHAIHDKISSQWDALFNS